ncbi:MAG: glycosyl hydrolase [Gammaproteobacteria bacterium]|jgi:mannan endo-1,4-beta-mannosidase
MNIKKSSLVLIAILVLVTFVYNRAQTNTLAPYQVLHALSPVTFFPESLDTSPVSTDSTRVADTLTYLGNLIREPRFLSGINIGNATFKLEETYRNSVVDLEKATGEVPAILSVDYLWEQPQGTLSAVNQLFIAHAKQGGLVTVNMHPGNPFIGGLYERGTGSYKFDDLFVDGTEPNKVWKSVLTYIGDGLKELEDNDVVVLFRPLHEMNGNWFWWSFGEQGPISREQYTKLWTSVYDYLIGERELSNLLWVYSPNSAHNPNDTRAVLELYPGDEFVDVVALDFYEDTLSDLNRNKSIESLLSLGKPFGFAEFGPRSRKRQDSLVINKELLIKVPQTSFLIHWHTNVNEWFPSPRSIIDNRNAKEYMRSESAITRKEVEN